MSGGLPGGVLLDSASSLVAHWAYRGVSCDLLSWVLRKCLPWRAHELAPRLDLPQRPVHTQRSKNDGDVKVDFLSCSEIMCCGLEFREDLGAEKEKGTNQHLSTG